MAMEAAHPVRVEEYTSLPDTAGRVWASLESLGAPHLRPLNPLQVHRTANARIAMAAWLLRSERLMEMIKILAASRCASASNSGYSKRPIVATSVARAWSPGAPNPALGAPAAV